ncbi:RNA polymerase, sigma subunit, ECF family [Parapedobacter indicus]|uniref:RNA polymerase, sigma subunit, ECF family n=2 Tax=Parapedobacter indicus TaxID=1477437 RepID=A0A1I3HRL5_9SPHI|nr:RNA polymerase sigma-70 factor (ECF subfamily) [Parapedobacter indicus]SFI38404.1 RNA polymerase, sigma subunit, ECF family [Parapedobacter indicus]
METVNPTNERAMLLRLREGDHEAFGKLFSSYSPIITGHLLRLLKVPELVEELVQDTFLSLWEHRERIDPDKPLKAYIFQIAINNARDLFRRAMHDKRIRALFYQTVSEGYEHIETELIRKENSDLLSRLLDRLPERQRNVYILCKVEGLSYREVSGRLGISENTVNSHIKRANALLKEYLAGSAEVMILLILFLF